MKLKHGANNGSLGKGVTLENAVLRSSEKASFKRPTLLVTMTANNLRGPSCLPRGLDITRGVL